MDPASPRADALAIVAERIVAVGPNEEIESLIGASTTVTDLEGGTVLPGFIDCHIHLIEFGLSLRNLDLRGVQSIEEMKSLVADQSRNGAAWILGRGWDQERLADKRYPSRQELDEASPGKPVLLRRVCGHVCVVNSAALKQAGIDVETPDPVGGVIDRDALGELTGILRETAVDLVERVIPPLTLGDYERATIAACQRALEAGLTTVHCITSSDRELKALLALEKARRLPLRFYLFIPVDQLKAAESMGLRSGFGDEWVRLGGLKIFTDGSLGGRTAALEAPYADDPDNRGITMYSQELLNEIVAEAHHSDFQLAVHAIGDKAVRMSVEAIAKACSSMPERDLRHRIEHASVLNPDLIRRIRRSGIIASVQPHFVVSDFWVKQRLGESRSEFTYPFSSLVRAGIRVVAGSDCPVEPLAPLSGIGAAVDRSDSEEGVSVEDAISFYTRNAAYASFEEGVKGTITPGKLADIVVLEKDPRKVPPSAISKIQVQMTIVGGKIAYRRSAER